MISYADPFHCLCQNTKYHARQFEHNDADYHHMTSIISFIQFLPKLELQLPSVPDFKATSMDNVHRPGKNTSVRCIQTTDYLTNSELFRKEFDMYFPIFHIGFLYQNTVRYISHPAFDHRGLSIDTPSISYL